MNLKTYFLNVALALAVTFIVSWMFLEPFSGASFTVALLGAFFWDYWKFGECTDT